MYYKCLYYLFSPHRLVGPGLYPFKVTTRVQIPLRISMNINVFQIIILLFIIFLTLVLEDIKKKY